MRGKHNPIPFMDGALRPGHSTTLLSIALGVAGVFVAAGLFWLFAAHLHPMACLSVAVLAGALALTGMAIEYLLLIRRRSATVEQRVAERTGVLLESEQRLRRLVENAVETFTLRDEEGKILDVNRWACESLGYTREELLSMNIADVDPVFISGNLNELAKRSTEKGPVTFEGVHRRKDGTTFPVEVRTVSVMAGGKRLLLSLARDITDRKKAEMELHNERRFLRELLDLQERDRKLVAYEIHDGLAQQLTGALYKFQSIERLRERDPAAADDMFDEALVLLRESLAEARRLIGGLRPPILDDSGVAAAIDYLIMDRRQHGGPVIEFIPPSEFKRLAGPLEGALFRIAQECLTNACRYSKSPRVQIELSQTEDRVRLEVRDWGIGFDPGDVESGHVGLAGIRERAQLLGGKATIESARGQGTCVRVEFPVIPPINGTN